MQDPFYVVKEEVQQSVQGIVTLYERWRHLLETTNTAHSDEFKWTSNELKNGIKSIDWDLNDLDETISIVESNRAKFKLDQGEVERRRAFVAETKRKIQEIKDELTSAKTKAKMDKDTRETLMTQPTNAKRDRLEHAIVQDNEEFVRGQQEQQTMILLQQDDRMEVLGSNVVKLKEIGNTIGTALTEHETLISEMENETNKADAGIKGAIKKLNDLIDSTKDGTQWAFIILLIIVLVGLIILVFYV